MALVYSKNVVCFEFVEVYRKHKSLIRNIHTCQENKCTYTSVKQFRTKLLYFGEIIVLTQAFQSRRRFYVVFERI